MCGSVKLQLDDVDFGKKGSVCPVWLVACCNDEKVYFMSRSSKRHIHKAVKVQLGDVESDKIR